MSKKTAFSVSRKLFQKMAFMIKSNAINAPLAENDLLEEKG
jgi:hypothetical protein